VGENATNLVRLRSGSLIAATALDNYPAPPFGGRILSSADNGLRWVETAYFPQFTDVSLAPVGGMPTMVLAGTMTKLQNPPDGVAIGNLYSSNDSAQTWTFLTQVVSSSVPSAFRRNMYVCGVSAMVSVPQGVLIGTVNEGEHAEIYFLPRNR
jgi:hypothetical protein